MSADIPQRSTLSERMQRSTPQLVRQVAERHEEFCRWYRMSKESTERLRPEHYAALISLEQIPSLYTGYIERIQKISITIPPAQREDKNTFCFALLKLFLCAVEDSYDGDYLIGRAKQVSQPSIMIARVLPCAHLALFYVSIDIQGNMAVLSVYYAAFDSRIHQNGTALQWHHDSWKTPQLSERQFGDICKQDDSVLKNSRRVVRAKVDHTDIRHVLAGSLIYSVFGTAALFILLDIISEEPLAIIRDEFITVSAICTILFLVWLYITQSMARQKALQQSLKHNPSALFYHIGEYANLMQWHDHQIFSQAMLKHLELSTKSLEKNWN